MINAKETLKDMEEDFISFVATIFFTHGFDSSDFDRLKSKIKNKIELQYDEATKHGSMTSASSDN